MATPQINEFDIMRQRIRERELQRGKETAEAVKGQFASRGTLQSGAQIKAQERGREQVARQAQDERRDILIAEAQTRRAEREAALQRQFQTQERIGAQEFASSERLGQESFLRAQAEAQRIFTTSEREALQSFQDKQRLGAQEFTSAERAAAEKFQGIQAEAQRQLQSDIALGKIRLPDGGFAKTLQGQQLDIQSQQFNDTLAEQIAQREQNAAQFEQEMAFNRTNSTINAITALKNSGFNDLQIKQIFDELGIEPVSGSSVQPGITAPAVATSVYGTTVPAATGGLLGQYPELAAGILGAYIPGF